MYSVGVLSLKRQGQEAVTAVKDTGRAIYAAVGVALVVAVAALVIGVLALASK